MLPLLPKHPARQISIPPDAVERSIDSSNVEKGDKPSNAQKPSADVSKPDGIYGDVISSEQFSSEQRLSEPIVTAIAPEKPSMSDIIFSSDATVSQTDTVALTQPVEGAPEEEGSADSVAIADEGAELEQERPLAETGSKNNALNDAEEPVVNPFSLRRTGYDSSRRHGIVGSNITHF